MRSIASATASVMLENRWRLVQPAVKHGSTSGAQFSAKCRIAENRKAIFFLWCRT